MVESAVGAVESARVAAIAAGVVSVSAVVRSAAAASAAVIASGVAAAVAIDKCVLVATNSSTYAAVLATWTDLWACTATCAICH